MAKFLVQLVDKVPSYCKAKVKVEASSKRMAIKKAKTLAALDEVNWTKLKVDWDESTIVEANAVKL